MMVDNYAQVVVASCFHLLPRLLHALALHSSKLTILSCSRKIEGLMAAVDQLGLPTDHARQFSHHHDTPSLPQHCPAFHRLALDLLRAVHQPTLMQELPVPNLYQQDVTRCPVDVQHIRRTPWQPQLPTPDMSCEHKLLCGVWTTVGVALLKYSPTLLLHSPLESLHLCILALAKGTFANSDFTVGTVRSMICTPYSRLSRTHSDLALSCFNSVLTYLQDWLTAMHGELEGGAVHRVVDLLVAGLHMDVSLARMVCVKVGQLMLECVQTLGTDFLVPQPDAPIAGQRMWHPLLLSWIQKLRESNFPAVRHAATNALRAAMSVKN
eukprot:TRINITY_DN2070_c0_g1_i14.p1 TRINITY_DN2070_c0_g1~~TRINITY_DN2070_c0_g1_i14.p1  ORF type:complete len:324 (+),score=58.02 TRINITY_DN2070_c0_g1_i14:323-1294(+)